ncbi:prolyl-tRNA synthetase [Thermotomaculum hydrothermale]|uniref:Proline--tRNA ligase n=1 Tax=Thermotomaculum hydrothermale TaxID=981385 RepID=A0A7R6SZ18_9BACT|nr:proline--tRNA ligase [Thermotomaculum hydrothermale]BBB32297.1 prolyl-tRNA synthetase [Thermotomaculum hydrothermale]
MRFSRYFLYTLKENPKEAETVSHRLMLRACMIKKLASGIYSYLPLGYRVIKKIENIIREELDKEGCIELLMPAVQPAELWQESGRWDYYGKELLRFKDRKNGDFCLGPTHEEVITDIVRKELRSYKQLPLNLYQIQSKFRDEIRPRYGLMRGREFIMKDAYSFDVDDESCDKSYWQMYDAYTRIFKRCGLKFRAVEADSGAIGGNYTHEFHVLAETGEDTVLSCNNCSYTANIEKAECLKPEKVNDNIEMKPLEKVETPNKKSVEEVSEFLGVKPSDLVKTMIFKLEDGSAIAVLVRGDYEVNEVKVKNHLGVAILELADEETIENVTGGPSGFSGPIGLKIPVYADYSVLNMNNFVVGANEKDMHFINVNLGRDFEVKEFADLRLAVEGETCPRCKKGTYEQFKGIEVGQVFKLGTKYSKAMNCTFLDENGKERYAVMGCYGIGVGRTAAAAIEQNHDENGIIWPVNIAPFQVILLNLEVKDKEFTEKIDKLYQNLLEEGFEVLYDDRDVRPGFKFKDADLIGIPVQIIAGKKTMAEGLLELKVRRTGERIKVKPEELIEKTREILENLRIEEENR